MLASCQALPIACMLSRVRGVRVRRWSGLFTMVATYEHNLPPMALK